MKNASAFLSTEIPPDLQNGSAFTEKLLYSIYGDAYFSSHRIVWVRICLILLYSLFALIGVTTNAAVVFFLVIWHSKSLRNITNRFVLALAISDIVMSGFNMPMQAYYEMQEHAYFSNIACRLIFSTFGIPMHISCLVILVIGIDRYRIIVYPLRRRMPRSAASLTLFGICLISVISVIPIALFNKSSQAELYDTQRTPMEYHYCVEQWPSPEIRLGYTIFTFIVQFFLPLLLTATLYTRIYFRLHERRFRKRDLERKKRTNKILIAIVICFFICWTPWNVFSIILEVYAYQTQSRTFSGFPPEVDERNISMVMNLKYLLSTRVRNSMIYQDENSSLNRQPRSVDHQYNISAFVPQSGLLLGGHAKLIDLILKLLAMCSGCLNPCLYGCMTDTMRLLLKRMATNFQRTRHHSHIRLLGSLFGLPEAHTFDHGPVKTEPAGKCEKSTFGKILYNINCCGFRFIVRTGFHQQKDQTKGLLDAKKKTGSSTHKNSSSCRRTRRGQQYLTNGENSPHPCGEVEHLLRDQKFVEHRSAQNAMGTQQLSHNLQNLDPPSTKFLHRESATLSIIESSTKRTSLLPSSYYDKTPRGSFMVDGAKQQDSADVISRNKQLFLSIPDITAEVKAREPGSLENYEPPLNEHLPNQHPPANRNQKLVNIEVHTPSPYMCTRSSPRVSFHRRSFGKEMQKNCKTLASLEETSVYGNVGECDAIMHEKGIMVEMSQTGASNGQNKLADMKRDCYKRNVSMSCDNESSRHLPSLKKRRSFQKRRRSTYDILRMKVAATSDRDTSSAFLPKEGSAQDESMISDDFAHFHKIVLQDERLKVNLAPKKPRKSLSNITTTAAASVKSKPRKPSIYSLQNNRRSKSIALSSTHPLLP
ncbi:hypothetical protein Aperf_G00000112591 [Anoplocephala perfoliata]